MMDEKDTQHYGVLGAGKGAPDGDTNPSRELHQHQGGRIDGCLT
jgi:hypothetical protein